MKVKDHKCTDCGRQAECFYPCVDPDIPAHPYCKNCAMKRKKNLIKKLLEAKR